MDWWLFRWFPSFVLVPVLFGSILFSAQNQNFGWFPSLVMIPSVVWLQSTSYSKSTFSVVPITCHGSQCCLAPKCFLLKIIILGGSLRLSWFPVLFSSKVLSAQNQHFGWFPSFFMVPSVVWLQRIIHSKFNILGGFAWLRSNSFIFLWLPVLLSSRVWEVKVIYCYFSQILIT